MKKKSPPISMFVMIAIIGLVISVVNGDFQIGSYFEDMDTGTLDSLLDFINIGLGFLALAGVFIFFFIRAARGEKDKEYFWTFNNDEDKEGE